MYFGYDECLEQNPFFQLIQESHSDVIAKATEDDWIICIPRIGTIEPATISTEDILEHILVPNLDLPDTHFCTLTKQEISIRDRCIVRKDNERIRILFDETFYIDKSQKYKLWCIERPLHQNCFISACDDYGNIRSIHDCVKVLWTKNRAILDVINRIVEKFLTDKLEFDNIEILKNKSYELYVKCVEAAPKESYFSDKVNLAIETYIQHCIHHKLFRAVCNYTSQADSSFNKIVRNHSDIQLKDLQICNEFFESISNAKRELSSLNKVSTILGKIESLRCVVNTLSNQKESFVTTDDLLKIFVLLIIKSNVSNWIGNLTYVTHFRFSALNLTDDNSFLITTLEAAIEYIKSGDVRPKRGLDKDSLSISSLNDFLVCVEVGDLNAIRKVFDSKNKNVVIIDKKSLCHPLCSCEKCKSFTSFNINSRNDKGRTALHVACLHEQPHIVEYLLSKNVEINAVDHAEAMPLHCAALRGSQNALLLLLHADADLESKDCDGNTPLHLAANNGHENCVKAFLYFVEQKGCFIEVNSRNNMGDTPLHFAAKWGYTGIVNILLQYGAKVSVTNKRNQSVLDVAHNDYLKKLLLATKTAENQIQSLNYNRANPDSNSLRVGTKNIVQLKKTDLVLKSIENNDLPLTCFYLGIPTPQNATNLDTKLTCHPLCTCDNCQKQFENAVGTPPSLDCSEVVNINTCSSDGYFPLHVAAKCGRTEILRLLLDSGALVNVKTSKHHCTPLHLACKNQRTQIVRELLQCGGCDLDVQDAKGNTPLHYACLSNDSRIVELLLSNGSDCNVKNGEGKTPLQEAKGRMLCNIVKLLKGKCGSGDSSDSLSDLFSL